MSDTSSSAVAVTTLPPQAQMDDTASAFEQEYQAVEGRFEAIARDIHLPFLEVKLYRKYFIQQRTPHRLTQLKEVVHTMAAHRLQTLRILKTINDREVVMQRILEKCKNFESSTATVLETQSGVLHLLYLHQQVTLKIVEGIIAWRASLTRPYPFNWHGRNYIQKIVEDCAFIDACGMQSILPLRVTEFPLCSNIVSSLALFAGGEDPAMAAAAAVPPPSKPQGLRPGSARVRPATGAAATAPAAVAVPASKAAPPPPVTAAPPPPSESRLRAAENVILEELGLQQKVMRELTSLCSSGCFVPILFLQTLVPNCAGGIRLSVKEWEDQLQSALVSAQHEAEDVAALAKFPPKEALRRRNRRKNNGSKKVERGRTEEKRSPPRARSASPTSGPSRESPTHRDAPAAEAVPAAAAAKHSRSPSSSDSSQSPRRAPRRFSSSSESSRASSGKRSSP